MPGAAPQGLTGPQTRRQRFAPTGSSPWAHWCSPPSLVVSRATLPTSQPNAGMALLLCLPAGFRSEEHTSELQSLMRISYAVFCLQKKKKIKQTLIQNNQMYIHSQK